MKNDISEKTDSKNNAKSNIIKSILIYLFICDSIGFTHSGRTK